SATGGRSGRGPDRGDGAGNSARKLGGVSEKTGHTSDGPGEDPALAAKVVAKSAGGGVEDRVAHVRAGLEQRTLFGFRRLGEDLIEVDLGRARWLALQVGVHLGHTERADAVGQGVVL